MRLRRILWPSLFLISVLVVIGVLVIWENATSVQHVYERTQHFAAIMQIVRPIIFMIILALWRPAFDLARDRAWVSEVVHHRAQLIWPRLAIWILLIEITLGQGYLLLGLAGTALYWLFGRIGKGETSDGR